jgi:hypothetical protein
MDLEHAVILHDKRLLVTYQDKGATACELKVAGDTIIFHMHTNVFKLDQSHSLWKTSYLEEDDDARVFRSDQHVQLPQRFIQVQP